MKKFSKITVLLLLIIVSIVACQKDFDNEISNEEAITEQKADVEVVDGILHFKDVEAYENVMSQLGKMENEERDKWEDDLGFYSLRRVVDDIYDEMDSADSKSSFNSILIQNRRFIKEEGDMIEEIIPVVQFQSIINKDGFFYIEKVINKVAGTEMLSSKDGKVSTIEKIEKGIINTDKDEGVTKYSYFEEEDSSKVACGYSEDCSYTNSSNWRKVVGKVYITYSHYFGIKYVSVNVQSKSYKKSWGRYRAYKTKHQRKEVHYQWYGGGSTFLNDYGFLNQPGYRETSSDTKVWSKWNSQQVYFTNSTPYLHNISAKFSTRGVGNHWAEIDCN